MKIPGKIARRCLGVAALAALALCVASCATQSRGTAKQALPRVFVYDAHQLAQTRELVRAKDKDLAPAVADLEDEAKRALGSESFTVTSKALTPPSGDKRDYMSMAPYYWPDPEATSGLPYIRRDGEVNPEINKITDHRTLDRLGGAIDTLGLAYYFLGDEAYAKKATELLRVFFFDPKTRMNPNFQFAQAVRGMNDGRGIGIIESRSFIRVVDGVGLLAGSKSWTSEDQQKLEKWFSEFLAWMRDSENGKAEAAAANNHGTYYDLQAVSYALFVGNNELATNILNAVPQKRIVRQVEPDGRQPLELVRTKAWGYSTANLSGLMSLAVVGRHLGIDLWHFQSADGRSIRKALDFLAPYSLDGKKWQYQQINGFSHDSLYPLIRRAAVEYNDPEFRAMAAKVPELSADSRMNLLRPKPPKPAQP